MSEFDSGNVPKLTLDPILDQKLEQITEQKMPEERAIVKNPEEEILSPEEKKLVEDFKNQIDITNSAQIMRYGAGTQQKMAGFSEKALENVRSKDLGEVGDMLTQLVGQIREFEPEAEEKKGFFGGLFKKANAKMEDLKAKYDKTEISVNKIVNILEDNQVQLLKDISVLDQMYEMNKSYYKELTMYILAGKKRLAEVENGQLAELKKKAEMTKRQEDAQAANDLQAQCDRFDKKLSDLDLTRMVSIQTAPQIRLIQNNDTMMAEKIQSTIVNTIPLWKNQMLLALGISHSTQAMQAQRAVSDMTNELLKKNAEKLKMATVETAKESQRGIVDIETLKQTNSSLIETLDEVMKIQSDGRQKRRDAEVELRKLEEDVRTKLLEMR